jgi:hypothetical protein
MFTNIIGTSFLKRQCDRTLLVPAPPRPRASAPPRPQSSGAWVAPTDAAQVKAHGDFDEAVTFENPVNDENELTEVVRPARTAPPRSQNGPNRAATALGVVVCILPLVGTEHCAFSWVPATVGDRMRRAKISSTLYAGMDISLEQKLFWR